METLSQKVGRKTFQGYSITKRNTASDVVRAELSWHIFFHPDYDRRLWLRTRSADPSFRMDAGRSRARHIVWHTAGGELHPALKTYCIAAQDAALAIVRLIRFIWR